MIALAWRTLRGRCTSLAGAFVALALGVTLLTVMTLTLVSTVGAVADPRWYSRAAVVVVGADTVSVTTGSGDQRRYQHRGHRADPRGPTRPGRLQGGEPRSDRAR